MIVPKSVRNSAKDGQPFVGADIWDKHYIMVARIAEDGDSLQTPCLGRTFLWVPDSPTDVTVEMYREEQSRGDVVRARHNVHENLFDFQFGCLSKVVT
jgi:L-rhamnose isomerase